MSRTNLPVLFIVGPTAVGKSALAVNLARAFDGEIVNADSRQVYRYMDIGTAKPSPEDRASVPHHLVDILDPDQDFSLAMFLDLARGTIQDIHARGRLPIVTGGTGQYTWALVEGWRPPHVPPDPQLRQQLQRDAGLDGGKALHERLQGVDPETASRIDPRNLRRVIRALEVYNATGAAPSTLRGKGHPPYHPFIVGLTTNRDTLYSRIDRRVEEMMQQGFVAEVEGLLKRGYSPDLASMSSMGYRETALHLRGELTLKESSQRIKHETHRFVRHQYTWFRLKDPRVHWLEAGPDADRQAADLVREAMGKATAVVSCGKMASSTQESIR